MPPTSDLAHLDVLIASALTQAHVVTGDLPLAEDLVRDRIVALSMPETDDVLGSLQAQALPAMAGSVWLNGFRIVRPTDEFAAGLGHDVIRLLRSSPRPTGPLAPVRKALVEVTAS